MTPRRLAKSSKSVGCAPVVARSYSYRESISPISVRMREILLRLSYTLLAVRRGRRESPHQRLLLPKLLLRRGPSCTVPHDKHQMPADDLLKQPESSRLGLLLHLHDHYIPPGLTPLSPFPLNPRDASLVTAAVRAPRALPFPVVRAIEQAPRCTCSPAFVINSHRGFANIGCRKRCQGVQGRRPSTLARSRSSGEQHTK